MRISDWSSDVCSSDLLIGGESLGKRDATIVVARRSEVAHEAYLSNAPEEEELCIQSCMSLADIRLALPTETTVVETLPERAFAKMLSPQTLWIAEDKSATPRFLYFHAHSASAVIRSEEHTSELQSLMPISYAVFCLK